MYRNRILAALLAGASIVVPAVSHAGDDVHQGVERVQPAQPPHESTGTLRSSGLLPSTTAHATPQREVPAATPLNARYNSQGRNVNPSGSTYVARGWDTHQQSHGH